MRERRIEWGALKATATVGEYVCTVENWPRNARRRRWYWHVAHIVPSGGRDWSAFGWVASEDRTKRAVRDALVERGQSLVWGT